MQIQMHHVGVQKRDNGLQLLPGICRHVHFAQHQPDEVRNVLILVGNLEREKADVAPGLGHEVASQVIQKIRLAAVGLPGNDYQSALIGGMKHLVGQRAIAHIVSMIVFATQHVQHLIRPFAYGDDVRRMPRTCRVDNLAHHTGTVCHKHIGYVLAAAGQSGEQAAGPEVVGKVLHECPPRQVAVTANHQFAHLVQPGNKSLETFAKVACSAVGHTDDIRVARLVQSQHIPSSFGDNQTGNTLFGNPQRVDAVDIIGRTRRSGRILTPAFGVSGRGRVARTILHVDRLPVDVVHIGNAVVHRPGSVLFVLAVLSTEAAVRQATEMCTDSRFQGYSLVGKITAGGKLIRVGRLRLICQRLYSGEHVGREMFVVIGNHRDFGHESFPTTGITRQRRTSVLPSRRCRERSGRAAIRPPGRQRAFFPKVFQAAMKITSGIETMVKSRLAGNRKVFLAAFRTQGQIILTHVLAFRKIAEIIKRFHKFPPSQLLLSTFHTLPAPGRGDASSGMLTIPSIGSS